MKPKLNHEQMNKQNWRYKKSVAPTEQFAHLNGPVKIIKPVRVNTGVNVSRVERSPNIEQPKNSSLPHPFKCSKCSYIAPSKSAFNQHWLDH